MKLEVGMYVRTKNGEIGKIRVIIDGLVFINTNQYYSTVSKASHNIIDLIEAGDYVNGNKVTKLGFDNFLLKCKTIECHQEDLSNGYEGVTFVYTNKDIKSIVTKEQFESMSYKIGD